jgi:FtsP/CotA-like multicopper oxidase with cupredoxin domain
MERRDFLRLAGGVALEARMPAWAASKADFTIRIAPMSVELAPGKTIQTVAYGSVPGPVIRMREGRKISVDIFNETDVPELVHWHGQEVGPVEDGAEEQAVRWCRRRDVSV